MHASLGKVQAVFYPATLAAALRFYAVLARELERARRYQTPLSIVMLHIDGLRDIVSDYGRDVARGVMSDVRILLRDPSANKRSVPSSEAVSVANAC